MFHGLYPRKLTDSVGRSTVRGSPARLERRAGMDQLIRKGEIELLGGMVCGVYGIDFALGDIFGCGIHTIENGGKEDCLFSPGPQVSEIAAYREPVDGAYPEADGRMHEIPVARKNVGLGAIEEFRVSGPGDAIVPFPGNAIVCRRAPSAGIRVGGEKSPFMFLFGVGIVEGIVGGGVLVKAPEPKSLDGAEQYRQDSLMGIGILGKIPHRLGICRSGVAAVLKDTLIFAIDAHEHIGPDGQVCRNGVLSRINTLAECYRLGRQRGNKQR